MGKMFHSVYRVEGTNSFWLVCLSESIPHFPIFVYGSRLPSQAMSSGGKSVSDVRHVIQSWSIKIGHALGHWN